MKGLKTAIKYGLIPCRLGYCGPEDKKEKEVLLKFINNEYISEEKIRKILQKFVATNLYYNLIARANNITDPFDEKVVEAYWIGNELLDPIKGAAHHSFHIYKIGAITNRIKFTKKLKDICRVSWGTIIVIKGKNLSVKYQPIIEKNRRIKLGKEKNKIVEWNKTILPEVKIGDIISIHWNTAIEILNKEKLGNLIKYTLLNIK